MKKIYIFFFLTSCFFLSEKENMDYKLKLGEKIKFNNFEIKFKDVLKSEECKKCEGIEVMFEIIKKDDTSSIKISKIRGLNKVFYVDDLIIRIKKIFSSNKKVQEKNYEVYLDVEQIEGKKVKFENIEEGFIGGITQRFDTVIRDEREFADLWKRLHSNQIPLPEIPSVDFEKYVVLASFMGEKKTGGYILKIEKIYETEKDIKVFVKEIHPDKNCIVTMAFTQPYHIVKIKKKNKKILFYHQINIKKCN